MSIIQKIKSGRMINAGPVESYVGNFGQIFYEESTGQLRLSDGVTPGGIILTTGVGGTTTVTVSLVSPGNTYSNTVTNVTGIRFDSDSGFDVINLGSGNVKIALNSTFKFWNVDGAPGLVAEGLDTVNFIASTGTRIVAVTSGTQKSLTFSLTTATASVLGAVKIGSGIDITPDGVISVSLSIPGASGYSGYSGVAGGAGQSGFSGYSGLAGDSGYSGVAGGAGQSGFSGYSGADAPAIIFDGGSPFNDYSGGPVFDAGGVT